MSGVRLDRLKWRYPKWRYPKWRYRSRRSGMGPVAQPVFKTGEVV